MYVASQAISPGVPVLAAEAGIDGAVTNKRASDAPLLSKVATVAGVLSALPEAPDLATLTCTDAAPVPVAVPVDNIRLPASLLVSPANAPPD